MILEFKKGKRNLPSHEKVVKDWSKNQKRFRTIKGWSFSVLLRFSLSERKGGYLEVLFLTIFKAPPLNWWFGHFKEKRCRLKFETVFSYCCVMYDVSEEEGICNRIITSWEVGLTAGCCSKAVRTLTHTFTSLPAL